MGVIIITAECLTKKRFPDLSESDFTTRWEWGKDHGIVRTAVHQIYLVPTAVADRFGFDSMLASCCWKIHTAPKHLSDLNK